MGIFIRFSADSSKISRQAWEAVFDEALKVAQAGKLCAVERREYDYNRYFVGVPSTPKDGYYCGRGIEITGELETGSSMETHVIPQSLGVDAPETTSDYSTLIKYLSEPEQYGLKEPKLTSILHNKTQGTRGHIWLLAMACVFCDAFPDATFLYGDITAGQVYRALALAEDVLGRELKLPVAFDMEVLLPRVRALAQGDELMTARLFDKIYQGYRDEEYNDFIKEQFSHDTLYTMFRAKATNETIHGILKDWMLLDLPLREVAQMLVSDSEGPQHSPEEFVKEILKAKLHVEDKPTYDAAHADNHNDIPDGVDMLFSRMAAMMFGIRNWAIDRYIPLEQLKADCVAAFGDRCDIEALFADTEAELEADEHQKAAQDIYRRIDDEAEKRECYEIYDPEDMFDWTPGCSVDPKLLESFVRLFKQAYEVTAEIRTEFSAADQDERIEMLIELGGMKVLLSEKRWDDIFEHVMDDDTMLRYITLFGIGWNGSGIPTMCRALLYNDELYEEVERLALT